MAGEKLPKVIYKLGWVSFFADICSEMVYPAIPLFVVGALRAPVAVLTLIEGVAEATVSFIKGWSGFHADRTGKGPAFIKFGYFCSGLAKPLLALAFVWPVVLFTRVMDRFGKGVRTPSRDALIADAVDEGNYGRAYGFHSMMDNGGALIGALFCAAFLYFAPGQFRPLFLLAGIPGVIAAGITLTLHGSVVVSSPQAPVEYRFSANYWRAMALSVLFAVANSSDTLVLLNAKEQGYSVVSVILLYVLYNVTLTAIAYPAGVLSDRLGRWGTLAVGWGLYGAVYLAIAKLGGNWMIALFLAYGLSKGITDGVTKALVADHLPKQRKGGGIGLFFMVSGFATLLGNLVAGQLWDRAGRSEAFLFGAVTAFVGVAMIPVVRAYNAKASL